MAIHGNVMYPEQLWADTLAEADKEARKMSIRDGYATVIKSTDPAGNGPVYYVESKVGMIRTWETELNSYRNGRIINTKGVK